jgi:superfamily II DNA or RNA helicase
MTKTVDLLPFFSLNDSILLMMAPPGWGKTTLILDLYERIDGRIVFISPLKALCEEFFSRASSKKNVFKASDKESHSKFLDKKKSMLVGTAEKLEESLFDQSVSENILFIFDEFHLFYYWGDSFRPLLQEKLMCAANSKVKILALTATMDKELLRRWQSDFINSMSHCYKLNIGNQALLNNPKRIYNYNLLNEKIFNRAFIREVTKTDLKGTIILFVRYRNDVKKWMNLCENLKISHLGCIGGEVDFFLKALKECPKPKCIISTSALSHGVNLPTISSIFLSYPVDNKDFWIQMVGRGGRDGSEFDVHEVERWKWRGSKKKVLWNIYLSMLLLLRDFFQTLFRGKL